MGVVGVWAVVWVVVVDEWFDGSLDVGQQRTLVGIFAEVGRGGRGWWQAFTERQTLRIWHLTYNTQDQSQFRHTIFHFPPTNLL